MDLLLRPSLHDVERALDRLAARAAEARRRGEDAQALFYYSGHARANALNLAGDELPLDDLRARLVALPATITIVVLDACQSGAISHIKGAEPTADFSFNSVNRLTNTGIAVMASSTGTELSQESETLRSSYFTHHLLAGLRGAGDADRDGRVTLVEAYRLRLQPDAQRDRGDGGRQPARDAGDRAARQGRGGADLPGGGERADGVAGGAERRAAGARASRAARCWSRCTRPRGARCGWRCRPDATR